MYSIVFLISSLRGLKKTGTGELGSSTKSVGNIKRKNSKKYPQMSSFHTVLTKTKKCFSIHIFRFCLR